jgi:hypothetical protein
MTSLYKKNSPKAYNSSLYNQAKLSNHLIQRLFQRLTSPSLQSLHRQSGSKCIVPDLWTFQVLTRPSLQSEHNRHCPVLADAYFVLVDVLDCGQRNQYSALGIPSNNWDFSLASCVVQPAGWHGSQSQSGVSSSASAVCGLFDRQPLNNIVDQDFVDEGKKNYGSVCTCASLPWRSPQEKIAH